MFGTTTVAGRLKKMQQMQQMSQNAQTLKHTTVAGGASVNAGASAATISGGDAVAVAAASVASVANTGSGSVAGAGSGAGAITAGHWLVRVKWHLIAIEGGKDGGKEGGNEGGKEGGIAGAIDVVPVSVPGLDSAPGQGLDSAQGQGLDSAPGQGLVDEVGSEPAPGPGLVRLKAAQYFHDQVPPPPLPHIHITRLFIISHTNHTPFQVSHFNLPF